jgi:hypothetical protein
MQFIKNGPDIPERLLQAHEDGRVVFFCGAGISYPARLPDFAGLVNRIFSKLAYDPTAVQKAAIKAGQFDTAIGLLEGEIVGGRPVVRKALAEILEPDLSAPGASETHQAILTLGKSRQGQTHVITTNFDRVFEEIIQSSKVKVETFSAPFLPIPKNRWDGLVYLHGLLKKDHTQSDLDRLVVSSGDFGLAYLTERWASRFVSELFRNYIVCFVGYSINDPVLRYMMDALAADRLLGETPPEMFAFAATSKSDQVEKFNEWRAKNVTPILYRDRYNHAALHKTLRAWAATYRDGTQGKEQIVTQYAKTHPTASTQQDDFSGRLMWALAEPDGMPAKRFAEFNPVPTLNWLEKFSEDRYRHIDLTRFGVTPKPKIDEDLRFSLIRRPAPYPLAPWMALLNHGGGGSRWDKVMLQLANWLVRHLNDPALLLWLTRRGGQLHEDFAFTIERRLDQIALYRQTGNQKEISELREGAENAIPVKPMEKLWRLLLAGRIKPQGRDYDIYRWTHKFQADGLTLALRAEFRELLTPCITVREAFRFGSTDRKQEGEEKIRDFVDWDLQLKSDSAYSLIQDLRSKEIWTSSLPDLLSDLTSLLRDALDLMHELEGADEKRDSTYIQQPSIDPHPQNRDYRNWTVLIELTRDAWIATLDRSKEQAIRVAEEWWSTPYPIFKRLAFFAATHIDVIPKKQSVSWILSDGGWWLWSVETGRELHRLIASLFPGLDAELQNKLESAITKGPLRTMFKADIEPDRWGKLCDWEIWLRLAKMVESGAVLGEVAGGKFKELGNKNPNWKLEPDQRDEFPYWIGSGSDFRTFVVIPKRRRDLAVWLKTHPEPDHWREDDWRDRCRTNFATISCTLYELSLEGVWPVSRWSEALQVWSDDRNLLRSWRRLGSVLLKADQSVLKELSSSIGWWMQALGKKVDPNDFLFFDFTKKILNLNSEDTPSQDDLTSAAINHPIGLVTEALLRAWYRTSPSDGDLLSGEFKVIFSTLCEPCIDGYRYGRHLLSTHLISLYRVDPEWTEKFLLPYFDWVKSIQEARSSWQGFLWSPRFYGPLFEVLGATFLKTSQHYLLLDRLGSQYAGLLTYVALEHSEFLSSQGLANATRALPHDGLREAAHALVNALDGSGDQHAVYWANRVVPYLQKIWPKSSANISPEIADQLAQVCIAAKDEFPSAFSLLQPWLQALKRPDYVVHRLKESDVCANFPEVALDYLSIVIGETLRWPPTELRNCLAQIREAEPMLEKTDQYRRLQDYLRAHREEG